MKEINNIQKETPIYTALRNHKFNNPFSFHVPGHKNGFIFDYQTFPEFKNILPLDLTEITNLDDLHQAEGIIKEAQNLAKELYGSNETYFLVNGSTSGNLAMVMAVVPPKGKVLVQLNVHKSIYHALYLRDATPIFLDPVIDSTTNLPLTLLPEQIKRILEKNTDIKAIILSNPNYFGMSLKIDEIVELAHFYDIPVIVDEAHGAHYGFHPLLPKSALQQGADIVVHSAHKTLPTMTMGAMLHIQGNRISQRKLRFYLQLFQSSSPSYVIIASIDIGRYFLAQQAASTWEKEIKQIEEFKQIVRLYRASSVLLNSNQIIAYDPFRLVLFPKNTQYSSRELKDFLEGYGIYPELLYEEYILFILPLFNTKAHLKKLLEALKLWEKLDHKTTTSDIIKYKSNNIKSFLQDQTDNHHHYRIMNNYRQRIDEILDDDVEKVPILEAINRTVAEMVIPYPPGIPLVLIGEVLTSELISKIIKLKDKGITFQGVGDANLEYITVKKSQGNIIGEKRCL